jgi:hypothetical protein
MPRCSSTIVVVRSIQIERLIQEYVMESKSAGVAGIIAALAAGSALAAPAPMMEPAVTPAASMPNC